MGRSDERKWARAEGKVIHKEAGMCKTEKFIFLRFAQKPASAGRRVNSNYVIVGGWYKSRFRPF